MVVGLCFCYLGSMLKGRWLILPIFAALEKESLLRGFRKA